jgi:hypothetical protein
MYFICRARLAETKERNAKKIKIYWFEPMRVEDLKECKFYHKKT